MSFLTSRTRASKRNTVQRDFFGWGMIACALLLMGTPAPAIADDGGSWCEHAKLDALQDQGSGPKPAAGFDPETGRDTRVFAPDRVIDALHMKLELVIRDMETPVAEATQTLRCMPIGSALSTLTLDARALHVESVQCEGYQTSFTHDGTMLTIGFEPAVAVDTVVEIITTYRISDPPRGLIWTPSSTDWPERAAQLHTQGQPQTNNYWFPCRDFPNERLTTELVVTVPRGFEVVSNGELVSRRRGGARQDGMGAISSVREVETFRWVQETPHPNYLVSLVVGKFDVVDVGNEKLSLPVYVPPGRGRDVRATYGRTLAMVRHFEDVLGEKYPWHQYAQVLAHNFEAGGMENTGASTMFETALYFPSALVDHDLDGLISHELAHQWFGDLLTCNGWEHIWLNEGFATFMTAEWFRARDGEDGYAKEILSSADRVRSADTGLAPGDVGMASKAYRHPWETFRRGANPYPKGASVLHMLREMLGDAVFWSGMKLYVARHRQSMVETDQLRRAFEDVSGLELEQFFRQWTQRPGIPSFDVTTEFDASRAKLRIDVQQTQLIDSDNPAFECVLPMRIRTASGPDVLVQPRILGRNASFEVDLDSPPIFVAVNERLQTLARVHVTQPVQAWLQQLAAGPTLLSRVDAARALGTLELKAEESRAVEESLRRLVVSPGFPAFVREEGVKSLQARGAAADLISLAAGTNLPWEVRRTLGDALAAVATSDTQKGNASLRAPAIRLLRAGAMSDGSLKVRCANLRALARVDFEVAAPLVLAALETSSQSDQLRQAAIGAIVSAKPENGLKMLLPLAQVGFDGRTRVPAIEGVAALAEQDRELALRAITELLKDREHRPRMAAARALVQLRDARGVSALREAITNSRADEVADALREQLQALERSLAEGR
jgi:aminopeptidase N